MKLELQALEVSIQGSPILRGIDLVVESGEKVGLIGRNGAGKTTVIRSIVGLNRVGKGSIRLDGREVNALTPDVRARMGIGWMPEDRRLVPLLTVEENILLPSWANPALDGRKGLEAVYALIPELTEMASRKALQLSGGQQKNWYHWAGRCWVAPDCCCWMNPSKASRQRSRNASHRCWPNLRTIRARS